MLLLELLYILLHACTALTRTSLTAAIYKFDSQEGNTFHLQTLVETYAKKYNYSIAFHPFEEIPGQNLTTYDFALVESNDYRFLDPNPFVLTSIVPFISIIMIVPVSLKIDKFQYFSIPFQDHLWAALIVSPFCFAVLLRITNRKTSFLNHLETSFGVMLFQSIKVKATNNFMRTIMCTFMVSFSGTVWIIYSSSLGSFLTTTVNQHDFVFMCPESWILSGNDPVRYKVVGFSEYLEHIKAMDTSSAYCISSSIWGRNNVRTRRKYYFKAISLWKSTDSHPLRVNKNFIHLDQFNKYMISVFSFGLPEKWNSEWAISRSSRKINLAIEPYDPILRYHDFRFPRKLLIYGMLSGMATLCIELLVKKLEKAVFGRRFTFTFTFGFGK